VYSVLRIFGDLQELDKFGGLLNATIPNAYSGPTKRGTHFSVTISTSDEWQTHKEELCAFLKRAEVLIDGTEAGKISIQFDIACEPDDYRDALLFEVVFPPEMLQLLTRFRVGIIVSIYGQG
jgi:hypothetical protein